MGKKVLLFLVMGLFMISLVNAFEFDNVKNVIITPKGENFTVGNENISYNPLWETYPNIEIKNVFGLGKILFRGSLIEHSAICGESCSSNMKVELANDDVLIQEIRFKILQGEDNWGEQSIKDYQIYIKIGEEKTSIDDYEIQCPIIPYLNGSSGEVCTDVKVGSHFEDIPIWGEYTVGEVVIAGNYEIKIVGEKERPQTVDWQIKTNGEWLDELADWKGAAELQAYYALDQVTGVIEDSTDNDFHGISSAGTRGQVGKLNNSILYAGAGGSDIYANVSFDQNYSINFWAFLNDNPSATENAIGSTSANNGYHIALTTSNIIRFGKSGVDFTDSTTAVQAGSFQMITIVVNATHVTFYVNGTLSDANAYTTLMATGTNYTIGDNFAEAGWDGRIDEVAFYNRTITFAEVTELWNGSAGLNFSNLGASSITLNVPPDNNVSVITTVTFNASAAAQGGATIVNSTLYHNLTGTWHQNETKEIFGTINTSQFDVIFANGDVGIWNIEFCDTDGDCGQADSNRTLSIDSEAPTVNLNSPTGLLDYIVFGGNQSMTWNITDLNLDSCWYEYNETNTTVNCADNSTNLTIALADLEVTLYANDSTNKVSSNTTTWDYKVLEINQTFSNNTSEGSSEDFTAVVKIGGGLSVSAAILFYNGSSEVGTATVSGSNTIIEKENLIIPQVTADINVSFNWSLVLSDASVINLTKNNQTILNLGIDNCSTFTNKILNLTVVDEELQTNLSNTTIEVAIDLLPEDRSGIVVNLSGLFEDENPLEICLNLNISGGQQYSLDSIIRYVAEGYANEYYNIVNLALDNETGQQNITLFDLNSNDSTEFQLTFTGTDFLPVEGALIFVERQYIAENTFKTVELPATDSNGQTVLHLVRNDVIYNIRVIKGDDVLGTFLNIIAFCEDITIGSCTINLNALTNESAFFNYDEEVGIIYDSPPTYNASTNRVTFDFVSSDGSAKVVSMNVERRDVFGNISVCNNTVASTSGTLSCDIGQNLTDTRLQTIISVDGREWIESSVPIETSVFGNVGYAIWFILTLAVMLMFRESENGIILAMLASYIGAATMGWIVGGIIGVGTAGVWIIAISFLGLWQINKNRSN